jgi:DNA-binding MarR family transcriptional regulator
MAAHLRVGATRLARLLRRQGDTGLSPSQISALTSIERHGPMTLGQLADHERVAPPSITRVVDKLVERGLVVLDDDQRARLAAALDVIDALTSRERV